MSCVIPKKLSRIKRAGVLGIVLAILIAAFPLLGAGRPKPVPAQAQKGYIDLSGWDFDEFGAVSLDGEWELYEGQLLSAGDFDSSTKPRPEITGYVRINDNLINGSGDVPPPIGERTYRLIVKLDSKERTYGLIFDNIKLSSAVYVDGLLRGSIGSTGYGGEKYKPMQYSNYSVFRSEGDTAEIILQVANHEYPFPGVHYSAHLGVHNRMARFSSIGMAVEILGTSINILFTMYSIYMYYITKRNRQFLYSAVQFIAFSLMYAANGKNIIFMINPDAPYIFFARLQALALTTITLMIPRLIDVTHSRAVASGIRKAFDIIGAAYIIFVMIMPLGAILKLSLARAVFLMSVYLICMICVLINRRVIMEPSQEYPDGINVADYAGMLIGTLLIGTAFANNFLYSFNIVSSHTVGNIAIGIGTLALGMTPPSRFLSLYNRIERLDRAKDELVARTSYELRAPLYGIINITESIIKENEGRINDNILHDLIMMKDISLHLCGIVEDTIDITLLKNHELEMNVSEVELSVLSELVVQGASHVQGSNPVKIINNIKGPSAVRADEEKLRRILLDLIQYFIDREDGYMLRLSSKRSEYTASMFLECMGCTLSEKECEVFFEPYSKSVGTAQYSLNIHLVRELIERMGGRIWAECILGVECVRVIIELPLADRRRLRLAPEQLENSRMRARRKARESVSGTVLIMESKIYNMQTAMIILKQNGFHVLTASSAQEAMKLISHEEISLVLLDVMMQGMSGIEVCRHIREKHSLTELPILISAMGNTDYSLFLGFEAGANDFISKPFNERELIARVTTLIALKKAIENALKNEAAFLQAQIKPHFLYNALNTIIYFCYTDAERAAMLLTNFSHYLRTVFETDSRSSLVPLKRELDMVKAFIEIEQARFGDSIKVTYDIDPDAMERLVPQLCIQPIVENAIKHGLRGTNGSGELLIRAKTDAQSLVITVRDNGVGMPREKLAELLSQGGKNSGVGLSNTLKRIRRMQNADLSVESEPGKGTCIYIRIETEDTGLQEGV